MRPGADLDILSPGPPAIMGRSDPGPVYAEPRISSRGQVKMEGYLEKKGKMRLVNTWKRHWFVLDGRLLLYFKSQHEYARLSPCRGSLNMGLAACVRPGSQHGRSDEGLLLEVVLRSHVVILRAKDRVSHERWLQALLDCMSIPRIPSPNHEQRIKHPLPLRYPSADNLSQSQKGDPEKRSKHRTLPAWRRSASNAADWRPIGGVTDRLRTSRVYPLSPTPMENSSQSPSESPTPTPPPPPENAHLVRHPITYEENGTADITRSSQELRHCGVNGHSRQHQTLIGARDENQNQQKVKATLLRKAHGQHKGSCPEELSSWVRNTNGNDSDADYVKYSDPEDCDPRVKRRTKDSSSSERIEEMSTDTGDRIKSRKPLRSRLSFLAKVLSTVRRHSSHIPKEAVEEVLRGAPHTNGNSEENKINMVTSIEESSPVPMEMNGHRTDMFNMPPIEPPPDYDSVSPETEGASPSDRQSHPSPPKSPCVPELPPRRVSRPRSPWHDVPTNNSPVYVPTDEDDPEERHHHIVGVQRGRNRSVPHPIEHRSSHPQWSPEASSDHLAIFLSSESSDDDFHEDQVVLRRPLDLPNADPQGHVGLSRIEAAKLSLLLRAHEAGSASHRQRLERDDVCGDVDAIIARLEASSAMAAHTPFKPPLPDKRPVLRAQSFHVVPISSSYCHAVKGSTPDLRPRSENIIVVNEKIQPPALPVKVRRPAIAHSSELDDLLAQLTDMTQVPLRPAAGTRSLEERSTSCESDYDVPRPHSSLLQLIAQRSSPTKNGTPFSNSSPVRGIPPGGNMSPDSLDHPGPCGNHFSAFISPHRPHTWDAPINGTPAATSAKKLRDRSRRATLSGPIADFPAVVDRDVWQRIPAPHVPPPVPPPAASVSLEDISERSELETKLDLEVDSLEVAARCSAEVDVPVGMLVCIAEETTEESERSGPSGSVSMSASDGALRCAANTDSKGLAASDSDLMVSDDELGSPDHTSPHLQPDSLYCGAFGSIEDDSLEPKKC